MLTDANQVRAHRTVRENAHGCRHSYVTFLPKLMRHQLLIIFLVDLSAQPNEEANGIVAADCHDDQQDHT
jgi:hypothetical protein